MLASALVLTQQPAIVKGSYFDARLGQFPEKLYPAAGLVAKNSVGIVPGNTSSVPPAIYDEQLGTTLTQNFSSIAYNVTAVEQQDANGFGPAYLVNGLSNAGYWYQVGFSWDWPIAGGGYYPGFGFNYEVFSPNGTSVFPQYAGGLSNFSTPVNAGDTVELSLAIGPQFITLQAFDVQTGAIASEAYQSFGASTFIGLSNSISNSKGFFSGAMTEEYHPTVFNGSETKVTFSSDLNITSAWMWVDEFDANTSALIFLKSTPAPILYANTTRLQYFFFEGATLISNAHEFITGTLGSVLLSVSYSQIGGTPTSPPIFTYSSNGSIQSVALEQKAETFLVDNGSIWSVSYVLPGLNSSLDRWTTSNSTYGIANSDATVNIVYYHQFVNYFSYTIAGGETGAGSPEVTFESYGEPVSVPLSGSSTYELWGDAGTYWNASVSLPGSSSYQRWIANSTTGSFLPGQNASLIYYHENLVAIGYSVIGSGAGYSPPLFESSALNETVNRTLTSFPYPVWLNTGALWRVSNYLNGSTAELRWETDKATGTVNSSEIYPAYFRQSLVSFGYSVLGNGSGFVSPRVNYFSFGNLKILNLSQPTPVWADFGSEYFYSTPNSEIPNERWLAGNGTIASVDGNPQVTVTYQTQYFVTIAQPRNGGGVIYSLPSGWYNSSQMIVLSAKSDQGWELARWSGDGSGSFSGNSSDPTIQVNSPVTESAIFYPSVTILSNLGGKVSFTYDGKQGSIADGRNVTIFVAPLTEVSLSASSSSVLNLFTSWKGTFNSPSESILLQVRTPELLEATFGFNYPLIMISAAAVIFSILLIVLSIYRRQASRKVAISNRRVIPDVIPSNS